MLFRLIRLVYHSSTTSLLKSFSQKHKIPSSHGLATTSLLSCTTCPARARPKFTQVNQSVFVHTAYSFPSLICDRCTPLNHAYRSTEGGDCTGEVSFTSACIYAVAACIGTPYKPRNVRCCRYVHSHAQTYLDHYCGHAMSQVRQGL